jgi:hypothetical protein
MNINDNTGEALRRASTLGIDGEYNNGPYIGEIVKHESNGKLSVVILLGGRAGSDRGSPISVEYAPMFFGATPYKMMDANNRESSSSQTSYGMWFVPPDIGTRVLVHFIEGKSDMGYWTACLPEPDTNHMVPGIAASKSAELTPQEIVKLGTSEVPVVEVNRRIKGQRTDDSDKVKRPMHPFTLRLASQGLLKDPIRGISTSSARRETVSGVFGISTPGPVVVNGKKGIAGTKEQPLNVYASREGGTQFVMDDGYIGTGPKSGKDGIVDELVRIRTRTGHQILLHNSQDLIYIANSRGTAWIEMTSDGKIDVFANDSVSIHTENDFNFRADRNINIESGQNLNLVAAGQIHMESGHNIEGFAGDDVNFTAIQHANIQASGKVRITSLINPKSPGDPLTSGIDMRTTFGDINMLGTYGIKMSTPLGFNVSATTTNIMSVASATIKTGATMTIDTVGANFIQAGLSNNFKAVGSHIERALLIDMNGPVPFPENPTAVTNLADAIKLLKIVPSTAQVVDPLTRFDLPRRSIDSNATEGQQKGWENNNYYAQPDYRSIMKRVPTFEPWDHHENINADLYKPAKTDRDR